MSKVVRDQAYEAYVAAEGVELGTRIKDVRDQPLTPGGRARMTLFEAVGGGRPHPRMRFAFVPPVDPSPPGELFAPASAPTDADGVRAAIEDARRQHAEVLAAADLNDDDASPGSPRYRRHGVRVKRTAAFFEQVRARLDAWRADGTIPASQSDACNYAVHVAEDEAYAVEIAYDDADTGTYHSYGHDAPFVHYLERILETLPEEGSEAMAVLPGATRESVRRQREHAQAHLDWLMRHKYAYEVPRETDAERTIGGFLVDRETRHIASEVRDGDSLVPSYELLRIDPSADHPHAGAWIHRDAEGAYRLDDHSTVEVDEDLVRAAPRDADALTFLRAPKHEHLRRGVRFDWDESGWVDREPIDWVSWAGHCDIKAVLEQLGVTLTTGEPSVTEYRSDTGQVHTYDRDLLLEMLASMLELGSTYRYIDGTGYMNRGISHFGGSRNDSRPDRLQFAGPGPGKSFRWPLGGRQDAYRVAALRWPDGEDADMGTVFFRYLPDVEAVSFERNPRYLKTVEGDYNLIDVSGARLRIDARIDGFDPRTGYPTHERETLTLDLGAGGSGRIFLGTHLDDPEERKLYRAYFEPAVPRVVVELEVWERTDGDWAPRREPGGDVVLPLVAPLSVTLSREMKRDDPSQFDALLRLALREGQNICADTDAKAEVWNGVVTRLSPSKVADNREGRTEHWRVDLRARFGEATLSYLLQRTLDGRPKIWCPAEPESATGPWPDFLWQDIPDVGSKGVEDGAWIVNDAMWERGIVGVRHDPSVPSGFYVYDDHIKNVYELLFCGLGGHPYTIVHANKRYGFATKAQWTRARDRLETLRADLSFE